MDTIIYVCGKRGIDETELVKEQRQGYRLLKLAIPFSMAGDLADLEKQRRETARDRGPGSRAENSGTQERCIADCLLAACLLHPVQMYRQRRDMRRARRTYRQQERQWRQQLLLLQEGVLSRTASPYDSYLVYEDKLQFLEGSALWTEYFPLSEFRGWHEEEWVEELVPFGEHAHYLVLGYADCVGKLLLGLARRMKSLAWIVEDSRHTEQAQEIAEELCEEYGLAAALTVLEAGEGYKKIRPSAYMPVNVLDFSGEAHVSPPLAKGSIWLDMDSMEEKERRLGKQGGNIRYFSLKKLWRQVP